MTDDHDPTTDTTASIGSILRAGAGAAAAGHTLRPRAVGSHRASTPAVGAVTAGAARTSETGGRARPELSAEDRMAAYQIGRLVAQAHPSGMTTSPSSGRVPVQVPADVGLDLQPDGLTLER